MTVTSPLGAAPPSHATPLPVVTVPTVCWAPDAAQPVPVKELHPVVALPGAVTYRPDHVVAVPAFTVARLRVAVGRPRLADSAPPPEVSPREQAIPAAGVPHPAVMAARAVVETPDGATIESVPLPPLMDRLCAVLVAVRAAGFGG